MQGKDVNYLRRSRRILAEREMYGENMFECNRRSVKFEIASSNCASSSTQSVFKSDDNEQEEVKKQKHREAQKRYKRNQAEMLRRLKAYKRKADSEREDFDGQLKRRDQLIKEMETVVTIQNEEIVNLRNTIKELTNQHHLPDASVKSCEDSLNEINAQPSDGDLQEVMQVFHF